MRGFDPSTQVTGHEAGRRSLRRGRAALSRAVGVGISSVVGVGGASAVMAAHGNPQVALVIFGAMQVLAIVDVLIHLRLKWRYAQLHEDLVRLAALNPDNENLRTLLVDSASTCLDDVGERLPVRIRLDEDTPRVHGRPAT